MSDLLPQLIVLALGGAIAPPLLLPTILFLGSRRPLSYEPPPSESGTSLSARRWVSPDSLFSVPEGLYPTSHRPRSRVPRYLRGDGYRRTHSLRRGGRSEGT